MHSVTSNAVAAVVKDCAKIPDYTSGNIFTTPAASYTCTEDVFVSYFFTMPNGSDVYKLYIDGVEVGGYDYSSGISVSYFAFFGIVKKNSVISLKSGNLPVGPFKIFKLI